MHSRLQCIAGRQEVVSACCTSHHFAGCPSLAAPSWPHHHCDLLWADALAAALSFAQCSSHIVEVP